MSRPKKATKVDYSHTDEELRNLAADLVSNKVFLSDQLKNANDITASFPILVLMEQKYLNEMKKCNVVHFYEYNSKRMPMAVNGNPMFLSCRPITKDDYLKLREYEGRIRNAVKEVIECPKPLQATGDRRTKPSKQKPGSKKQKPSTKTSGTRSRH